MVKKKKNLIKKIVLKVRTTTVLSEPFLGRVLLPSHRGFLREDWCSCTCTTILLYIGVCTNILYPVLQIFINQTVR